MKRTIALLCAALLACLCFACGWAKPGPPPPEPGGLLLTLYADTSPMRIMTQQEGVSVAFQRLEYEPTLGFLRPVEDIWDEVLEPGKEYELEAGLAEGIPQHRLYARRGDFIALFDLTYDGREGGEVFEIEGKPWVPAPIDENSPMINLCRAAAVSPKEAQYGYWYAISNAICTQRGIYNEWPPDDPDAGAYHVPDWLFEAYAAALFPDTETPEYLDWEWVGYSDTGGHYLAYLAYSTWIWAEYKGAKQNPDGTWDITVTISAEGSDETMDEVIQLAPNAAYNPGSPFEYHIVGMPEPAPPEPADPPPEYVVGTWRAPVKQGHAAYLELFEDGIAGLYLGDDGSGQVYEIYRGLVSCDPGSVSDTTAELEMQFTLDWYIYEGGPVTGVPDTYRGTYTLRHGWEGDQQVLRVKANEGADPLFGESEMKMLWVPKTLRNDFMADVESMG